MGMLGFVLAPSMALSMMLLAVFLIDNSSLVNCLSSTSVPSVVKKRVIVIGSTGRLGREVVAELAHAKPLMKTEEMEVIAVVRDVQKAKEVLSVADGDSMNGMKKKIKIVKCDLSTRQALTKVLKEYKPDSAVWCAAGFTDSPSTGPLQKIVGALKLKYFPKEVIDITALAELGAYFSNLPSPSPSVEGPQVVMCSSAGVTRPLWSEEKKEKFVGAADIPIVRLNPLNILGVKRESEQVLRKSGCAYSILRPCGLNDKHPQGSRPVLSQGDVAVGRICRKDVASLLVELLSEPASTYKTFEAIAIPNLPVPRSYQKQLEALDTDDIEGIGENMEQIDVPVGQEVPVSDIDFDADAKLEATYALLQQLVPGDVLEPDQLAMGQTYEQQSDGEDGRLGKRGQEQAPLVRDE